MIVWRMLSPNKRGSYLLHLSSATRSSPTRPKKNKKRKNKEINKCKPSKLLFTVFICERHDWTPLRWLPRWLFNIHQQDLAASGLELPRCRVCGLRKFNFICVRDIQLHSDCPWSQCRDEVPDYNIVPCHVIMEQDRQQLCMHWPIALRANKQENLTVHGPDRSFPFLPKCVPGNLGGKKGHLAVQLFLLRC